MLRFLVGIMLRKAGHEVIEVTSSEECLEKLNVMFTVVREERAMST